jgi:hypothetical protein
VLLASLQISGQALGHVDVLQVHLAVALKLSVKGLHACYACHCEHATSHSQLDEQSLFAPASYTVTSLQDVGLTLAPVSLS